MNLLSLPPEVRSRIYDFCFPPPQTRVELLPYRAASPRCYLNLPLSLYLVCKFIYFELPLLSTKLRSLDFLYIVRGIVIWGCTFFEHRYEQNEDVDFAHFRKVMQFAERVRLVGDRRHKKSSWADQRAKTKLGVGPECALRVLEVQPLVWPKRFVTGTIRIGLGQLTTHPDVAKRLEIHLIRDDEGQGENEELDEIDEWLRR
ncbi:hypothetical protein MMC16_000187 [Acarospora aff. strigata]|nr:hypothetical protein [Acarospora aff. strigata]